MDEGGSRYGVSLSEEAHCRGPQGTRGYERKALETGISLHGGQLGKMEWACLVGTLRDG
jgi:hypothetical protein